MTTTTAFEVGQTVYVQRRPYKGKQTVHAGYVLRLLESSVVVRFVGKRGVKTQTLPFARLSLTRPEPGSELAAAQAARELALSLPTAPDELRGAFVALVLRIGTERASNIITELHKQTHAWDPHCLTT